MKWRTFFIISKKIRKKLQRLGEGQLHQSSILDLDSTHWFSHWTHHVPKAESLIGGCSAFSLPKFRFFNSWCTTPWHGAKQGRPLYPQKHAAAPVGRNPKAIDTLKLALTRERKRKIRCSGEIGEMYLCIYSALFVFIVMFDFQKLFWIKEMTAVSGRSSSFLFFDKKWTLI